MSHKTSALANLQDVALTGGELVVNGVLDVHNVEASIVTLTVGDDTNTTHVTTTSDHDNDTSVELDEVGDLAGSKVDLDRVVDLDSRVGVTDPVLFSKYSKHRQILVWCSVPRISLSAPCPNCAQRLIEAANSRSRIMRNTVGNSATAELDALDLAQLVCGLLASYPVNGVTTLGVEDEAEVLAGLVDSDYVHQSSGEGGVGADLAIDLYEALHEDRLDLTSIEGVL